MVDFFVHKYFIVVASPMSSPPAALATNFNPLTTKPTLADPHGSDDAGDDDDACHRRRQQELPAEGHEPVVAQTWQGSPPPDHDEKHDGKFDEEPHDAQQRVAGDERPIAAAEEQQRADGAHRDHVDVLGDEERAE